jgi:hypothetical protein
MLDVVKQEVGDLVQELNATAEELDVYGAPGQATAVRRTADRLRKMLARIEQKLARLSTQQYATQHGVKPDTVRRWVRAGQLQAAKGADGSWSIPYGAVRRKLRKVA